ncbi:hypothetical protein Avbf_13490 [Armadillidium vulgare]|nr:hypothetical protein Avbf_13490 [Armadillidium vulgare]
MEELQITFRKYSKLSKAWLKLLQTSPL